MEKQPAKTPRRGRFPVVTMLVLVALLVAVGMFFLNRGDPPEQRQYVTQTITLVPPPPPPPPPPEEKVEPEKVIEAPQEAKVQKDVQEVSEKPSPEPSTSEPSGLDRPADIGSDSFHVAAGKGGGLFGSGGGGGGTWAQFVSTHVRRALQQDSRTRSASGYIEVLLSIDAAGRFERTELRSSTGNRELDAAIRDVLSHLPPLSRGRPPSVQALTVTGINMRSTEG